MKGKIFQTIAAAAGAVASFFCGLPPILWVLLAVMSLDYITGLICGAVGKSPKSTNGGLSSSTAFAGLMKKLLIIVIVALAYLLLRFLVRLACGSSVPKVSAYLKMRR